MHRLRWLGALLAVIAAVALTVVAPAGAQGEPHPPQMRHCHFWPNRTEVHWDLHWLKEWFWGTPYIGPDVEVYNVTWHFYAASGAQVFPFPSDTRVGNEVADTVTPLFATRVWATVTILRWTFDGPEYRSYDTTQIGCT